MKQDFICFGEVLWDLLPSGKLPGGAPMNVAYHLHTLGSTGKMISKIGTDALGKELLGILAEKNIAQDLIQMDTTHPTGTVAVTLDAKGSPSYEIVQPVAWDYIELDALKETTADASVFIYGSLAARNETSKNTLLSLLSTDALKVLDVNLRVPFYSQSSLEPLLAKADLVKMNEEELAIISEWYNTTNSSEKEQLAFLQNRFQWTGIILTKGAEGAIYYSNGDLHHQAIFHIKVADTIGSGDAFLAGFLHNYIRKEPIAKCLRLGAFMGAYVATQKGAMPRYRQEDILSNYL